MQNQAINEILEAIGGMCGEPSIPKNIKEKFKGIAKSLVSKEEISVKTNKALHELDDIGEDMNLQPYVRTQVWNIASMLEKINP